MTELVKPSSNRHWAALAVAQYYEQNDEAARIRDLQPELDHILSPDQMTAALGHLDTVGRAEVVSANESGGVTTFAYYPTEALIDRLHALGTPETYPDGSPVTVSDADLPSTTVSEDEVTVPTQDAPPLSYLCNQRKDDNTTANEAPRTHRDPDVDGVFDVRAMGDGGQSESIDRFDIDSEPAVARLTDGGTQTDDGSVSTDPTPSQTDDAVLTVTLSDEWGNIRQLSDVLLIDREGGMLTILHEINGRRERLNSSFWQIEAAEAN